MIEENELMRALRISRSEAAGDYVVGLEKAAVAFVERKTNRTFTKSERTIRLHGFGHNVLWLPERIDPDATVTIDEYIYPGATPVRLTDSDPNGYDVNGAKISRFGGYVWTRGVEYRITYTAGYDPGDEPDDIRQAVLALVTLWYERRLPITKGQEGPVPMHVDSILRQYRRPPPGAV